MTLYQLECFIQVAEQLSFVRAAQIMCISQPAITYQIQTLEKEILDILKVNIIGLAFFLMAITAFKIGDGDFSRVLIFLFYIRYNIKPYYSHDDRNDSECFA